MNSRRYWEVLKILTCWTSSNRSVGEPGRPIPRKGCRLIGRACWRSWFRMVSKQTSFLKQSVILKEPEMNVQIVWDMGWFLLTVSVYVWYSGVLFCLFRVTPDPYLSGIQSAQSLEVILDTRTKTLLSTRWYNLDFPSTNGVMGILNKTKFVVVVVVVVWHPHSGLIVDCQRWHMIQHLLWHRLCTLKWLRLIGNYVLFFESP